MGGWGGIGVKRGGRKGYSKATQLQRKKEKKRETKDLNKRGKKKYLKPPYNVLGSLCFINRSDFTRKKKNPSHFFFVFFVVVVNLKTVKAPLEEYFQTFCFTFFENLVVLV